MQPPPRAVRVITRLVAWTIAGLAILLTGIYATLVLYVASLPWAAGRITLAVVFVLATLAFFIRLKPSRKALVAYGGLFLAVLTWYALIRPSNHRLWQPDVARVASVEFDDDVVTIRNVRNFAYRSVDDFDERWETRTYDLGRVRTTDVSFTYWGPTNIAHTMLSFGFDDGAFLCVSVETRKEIGETYDPLESFFKQFELIYVLADERDLIALRTNHRGEHTYLFPLSRTPGETRALLVDILERADRLGRKPEFYRTIRDNCTTSLLTHIDRVDGRSRAFSLELLLNGYMPEVAYERGQIPNDRPLAEVLADYDVTGKAKADDLSDGFSRRIRAGLGPAAARPAG